MKTIYIASGYNSWTCKQLSRAFMREADAQQFVVGLTDPKVVAVSYKSTVGLINHFLLGASHA